MKKNEKCRRSKVYDNFKHSYMESETYYRNDH